MSKLMRTWVGLMAWAAIVGSAWIALVPDFLSASSLLVVALSVTTLVFGASVVHRTHAFEPSIRQSRAAADTAAAARAALLRRLK